MAPQAAYSKRVALPSMKAARKMENSVPPLLGHGRSVVGAKWYHGAIHNRKIDFAAQWVRKVGVVERCTHTLKTYSDGEKHSPSDCKKHKSHTLFSRFCGRSARSSPIQLFVWFNVFVHCNRSVATHHHPSSYSIIPPQ